LICFLHTRGSQPDKPQWSHSTMQMMRQSHTNKIYNISSFFRVLFLINYEYPLSRKSFKTPFNVLSFVDRASRYNPVQKNQLHAQFILSIFRQPLHVSGVSRPIIRRYNRMYTTNEYTKNKLCIKLFFFTRPFNVF